MNCNYVHDGAMPPDICPVCGAEKEKFEAVRETEGTGTAETVKAVIVGGGVAGVSAAETIRKASPDSEITLICTESELPYYRLNLTRYLAGEISRDSLPLHQKEWFSEQRIDLLMGLSVEKILLDEKAVILGDDRKIPYEKLILTTGSHPYVPAMQGVSLDGVFTLRTSDDADRMLKMIRKGCKVVGIGGGILGLETAGALATCGADISVLESHDWLMPRQLNPRGGAVLERHIRKIGVNVIRNAKTREIVGDKKVTGVALQDGRVIPADMVLIATGVRPNTSIARKTGIEVNTGVIVDNHMRTSQADIFAAGDVAEHNGQVYGSWAASQFQGSIAALNAAGIPTQFGGLPRSNTVKALGLDLTSIGKFMPEDGSYIIVEEEKESAYLEFVFRDGRMQGAILIGHPELATSAKKAIESGKDFSALVSSNPKCADIVGHLE
jgi:nitrite reductase (NADH) large subunit